MKIVLVIYIAIVGWTTKGYEIHPVGVFNSVEECEEVAKREFDSSFHYSCMTEENYQTTVELQPKDDNDEK